MNPDNNAQSTPPTIESAPQPLATQQTQPIAATNPTPVDNPNLRVAHTITSTITIVLAAGFGVLFLGGLIFAFALTMGFSGGNASPSIWLGFIALLLVPIALFWFAIRYVIKSRRNLVTTGKPQRLSKQLFVINTLIALWLTTSIYRNFGYRASEAPLPPNISIGLFLCSLIMVGLALSSLHAQKTQQQPRGLYARPMYSIIAMVVILIVAIGAGSLSIGRLTYRDPDTNQPLFYVPYPLSETVKEERVGFTDSFDELGEGILGPMLTHYELQSIAFNEQSYFAARVVKKGDKGYTDEGDPGFYPSPEEFEKELKRRFEVKEATSLRPMAYESDHSVDQVGIHTLHTYRNHYIAVIFKPDYMVLIRYYYPTLNPTIEKLTFVD